VERPARYTRAARAHAPRTPMLSRAYVNAAKRRSNVLTFSPECHIAQVPAQGTFGVPQKSQYGSSPVSPARPLARCFFTCPASSLASPRSALSVVPKCSSFSEVDAAFNLWGMSGGLPAVRQAGGGVGGGGRGGGGGGDVGEGSYVRLRPRVHLRLPFFSSLLSRAVSIALSLRPSLARSAALVSLVHHLSVSFLGGIDTHLTFSVMARGSRVAGWAGEWVVSGCTGSDVDSRVVRRCIPIPKPAHKYTVEEADGALSPSFARVCSLPFARGPAAAPSLRPSLARSAALVSLVHHLSVSFLGRIDTHLTFSVMARGSRVAGWAGEWVVSGCGGGDASVSGGDGAGFGPRPSGSSGELYTGEAPMAHEPRSAVRKDITPPWRGVDTWLWSTKDTFTSARALKIPSFISWPGIHELFSWLMARAVPSRTVPEGFY